VTLVNVPTRYRVRKAVEPPLADVPGYDLKPDPAQLRTVSELAEALGRLRRWAGGPSFRELSSRCERGLPAPSTFQAMLQGGRLPAMDQVLVFVTALGLHDDLPQWAHAWRRVAFRVRNSGPTQEAGETCHQ
jgi:hypothetical protein